MDSDVLRGNIIKGVIALIVLIIGLASGWRILTYIAIVYLISDIVWILGDYNPRYNAVFTVILGTAAATTFVITKNEVHFYALLMWVGYFKSQRLWGQVYVYDQYYDLLDEKIYNFVNEDSSLYARFLATFGVCVFYVVLGAAQVYFTPLAFVPVVFLIYRMIRIFQTCE